MCNTWLVNAHVFLNLPCCALLLLSGILLRGSSPNCKQQLASNSAAQDMSGLCRQPPLPGVALLGWAAHQAAATTIGQQPEPVRRQEDSSSGSPPASMADMPALPASLYGATGVFSETLKVTGECNNRLGRAPAPHAAQEFPRPERRHRGHNQRRRPMQILSSAICLTEGARARRCAMRCARIATAYQASVLRRFAA